MNKLIFVAAIAVLAGCTNVKTTLQTQPVYVLVAAGKTVHIEEFSDMEKCSEAATYISVGTESRYIAKCVRAK